MARTGPAIGAGYVSQSVEFFSLRRNAVFFGKYRDFASQDSIRMRSGLGQGAIRMRSGIRLLAIGFFRYLAMGGEKGRLRKGKCRETTKYTNHTKTGGSHGLNTDETRTQFVFDQ